MEGAKDIQVVKTEYNKREKYEINKLFKFKEKQENFN